MTAPIGNRMRNPRESASTGGRTVTRNRGVTPAGHTPCRLKSPSTEPEATPMPDTDNADALDRARQLGEELRTKAVQFVTILADAVYGRLRALAPYLRHVTMTSAERGEQSATGILRISAPMPSQPASHTPTTIGAPSCAI